MEFSNVQDLPGPPLFEGLFLVNPLPTALAVIVLGIVAFEALRRRAKGRAAIACFVFGVLVGGAILLTGRLIVTDHEVIREHTERFVRLAAEGDRDRLEEMVSPRVALVIAYEDAARSADWLLDSVEDVGRLIVRQSSRWRGAEVRTPTTARGRITLHTEMRHSGSSIPSTWDFVWQRGEDGAWRVVKIEALSIQGRKPWRGLGSTIPTR